MHLPSPTSSAIRFEGTVSRSNRFNAYAVYGETEPLERLVEDHPIDIKLIATERRGIFDDKPSLNTFQAVCISPVGSVKLSSRSLDDLMVACGTQIQQMIAKINAAAERQAETEKHQQVLSRVQSALTNLAQHEEPSPEELEALPRLNSKQLEQYALSIAARLNVHQERLDVRRRIDGMLRQLAECDDVRPDDFVDVKAMDRTELHIHEMMLKSRLDQHFKQKQARQERMRLIQEIGMFNIFLEQHHSGKLPVSKPVSELDDEELTLAHAELRAQVMGHCPAKRTVKGTQKAKEAFLAKFQERYGFRP